MKRAILITVIFLAFTSLGFHVSAQQMEVKSKVDSIIISGSTANIELTVSGGSSPYTFLLYDKEPWDGGNLIEKTAEINETTHVFTVKSAGRYYVAVRDKSLQTVSFAANIKTP